MEKGISLFFGYLTSSEERVKLIKEAGFNCVMTSDDERFLDENGTLKYQCKLFDNYGLKKSSLHMRYLSEDLHYFWEDNKNGKKALKNLLKDVKLAKKFGFTCVVVHLFNNGNFTEIGKERLIKVLEYCAKVDIPLAIENINDQKLFIKVFDEIKHPYLNFCYDSGHNNCFDKDFDYLSKYGDKLIALHLHDNDGTSDQHTLNKFGNIDWDMIAQKLAKSPKLKYLDYELLMIVKNGVSMNDALNECYEQACELDKLIEKYKN